MTSQNVLRILALLIMVAHLCAGTVYAAAGDVYVTENTPGTLSRITANGTKAIFASDLAKADGLVFDRSGNAYVSLNNAGSIIKITPTGTKTTFVSGLSNPAGLAFDSDGYLFVAESGANDVVRYAPDGTKFVFASALNGPVGLAFDLSGNLFVSEHGNSVDILKFAKGGGKTVFASGVDVPNGLAVDNSNNLYVATNSVLGGTNGKILKFTPAGVRSTFASGLSGPYGIAFDPSGNLFAVDFTTNSILKFLPNGQQSTFAAGLTTPLFVAFEPALSQPLNISTRLNVGTGDNALIGGFIATGTVGKKIIVRGIGPSLANFGVQNSLQDPTLELRAPNGTLIASNDNWKINDQTHQSQQAVIQATGLAPTDDRESVVMAELAPAGFTAIVRGKNDTIGVGLVEIYDVNQTADSRLANISTRGYIGAGDTIIAGVIIGAGNGAAKLLVRVLGPSLAAYGITNALKDPEVDIRDSNGSSLAINNNWKMRGEALACPCPSQQAEIEATGLAPSNDYESAVIVTVPVGNYTAVAKANDFFEPSPTAGVAVVEVYNLR